MNNLFGATIASHLVLFLNHFAQQTTLGRLPLEKGESPMTSSFLNHLWYISDSNARNLKESTPEEIPGDRH